MKGGKPHARWVHSLSDRLCLALSFAKGSRRMSSYGKQQIGGVPVMSPFLTWLLLLFALVLYIVFYCLLWPHLFAFPSSQVVKTSGVSLSLPSNQALSLAVDEDPFHSTCNSGRVYVYNLPPEFNAELLADCASLIPWQSLCPGLSNNGIGVPLELPSWIGTGFWYATNQFSGEVIFHSRMLLHPCRTLNPEIATAFYIPFYAGLDLGRYLWVSSTPKQRDQLGRHLLKWLNNQLYWKRRGGWDHFLMIGRITWDFRRSDFFGWGNNFFTLPEMKNVTRLTIERSPWDDQEVGVPYPTPFHPRTDDDVIGWQQIVKTVTRNTLFSFAGAPRPQFQNDFRELLSEQCRRSTHCRFVDCSNSKCEHPLSTIELFLDSVFCLQPRGDSYTRRSIFDAMLAGCIPVFFWRRSAYVQYQWYLPADDSSYSVYISKTDIQSGIRVEDVLRALPAAKIKRMQQTLVESIPKLAYSATHLVKFKDAFDIAFDGALSRIKLQTQKSVA